jgi:RimJ/RimL family protein N-acetyltransferase
MNDPVPEVNAFGQRVGDPVPGWESVGPVEPVTLSGRTCRVEPLASHHHDELWQTLVGASAPQLWTYLPYGPFSEREAFAAYLAGLPVRVDAAFAVVVPDDRALGVLTYLRDDPANGSVEVGHIAFSSELQRTVPATEAVSLLIRHAFDDLGYRRFEWKCDSLNELSRRAAARYGFTFEGRFRNAVVTKGRNRDTDWFSIIDSEWPAVRAAHDRWLDAANFDAAGRQLSRLSELVSSR